MLLKTERAIEYWLKSEVSEINSNLVASQVSISKLLKMDKPKTLTKTGEEYLFDLEAL